MSVIWKRVEGKLKAVTCHGGPDAVWGVNAKGDVKRLAQGGAWETVPGALVQVDTGLTEVWGVNAAGEIYKRDLSAKGGGWTKVPGALICVAAGRDVVWGVNGANDIFILSQKDGSGWRKVPGALNFISCSQDGNIVWGVNKADEIYRLMPGEKWQKVSGKLKQVSVTADGEWVYGVNGQGQVFRSRTNIVQWEKFPGAELRYISAFSDSVVWGTNANEDIFQMSFAQPSFKEEDVSLIPQGELHALLAAREKEVEAIRDLIVKRETEDRARQDETRRLQQRKDDLIALLQPVNLLKHAPHLMSLGLYVPELLKMNDVQFNSPNVGLSIPEQNVLKDALKVIRPPRPGPRTRVFLAHTWQMDRLERDNHARSRKLKNVLEREGIRDIWFDEEKITSFLDENITRGVDECDVAIVCITAAYRDKINGADATDCAKKEFNYLLTHKADRIIPVVMEPCMRDKKEWTGAFGANFLSGRLYVDCAIDEDDSPFGFKTESIEKLLQILATYGITPSPFE